MEFLRNLLNVTLEFIIGSIVINLSLASGLMEERNQIFRNPLFNEATIEDFIEDDIFFEIIHPKELQYTYRLHEARNFGSSFDRSYRGIRLVVVDPPECCSFPLNSHSLKGAVALVNRGDCSFVSKTLKAEQAGAVAVIVMDNDVDNDSLYIHMINDNTNRKPTIPAAFLLGMSGHIIQRKLQEKNEEAAIINIPVNLTSVPIHKLNQPPWHIW